MDTITNLAGIGDSVLGYLVPFLFVLTLVVFIHELGHFLVARWYGIGVKVFSIHLLDAGWTGSTPVIAVENASRDDERRVAATVAELAAHPESLGLKSPAVLIFGEVAGLPAAGVVEDVLSRRELRRVYA